MVQSKRSGRKRLTKKERWQRHGEREEKHEIEMKNVHTDNTEELKNVVFIEPVYVSIY